MFTTYIKNYIYTFDQILYSKCIYKKLYIHFWASFVYNQRSKVYYKWKINSCCQYMYLLKTCIIYLSPSSSPFFRKLPPSTRSNLPPPSTLYPVAYNIYKIYYIRSKPHPLPYQLREGIRWMDAPCIGYRISIMLRGMEWVEGGYQPYSTHAQRNMPFPHGTYFSFLTRPPRNIHLYPPSKYPLISPLEVSNNYPRGISFNKYLIDFLSNLTIMHICSNMYTTFTSHSSNE